MSHKQRPPIPRNRPPCDPPPEHSTSSFWHSEPSALLTGHRSTRDLPSTADVIIVGSGATGASVAHHLLHPGIEDGERGVGGGGGSGDKKGSGPSVVMLEAREACWGATGRNGGHCQPLLYAHPHDPSIGRFELANFHAIHRTVQALAIPCEFVAQNGVRAIYDHQLLWQVESSLQTVRDLSPDLADRMNLVTDARELKEEWRVPGAVGAVVTSIAARMWPYKFVAGILERLLLSTELAGQFNLQTLTPVESLERYDVDRWLVKTARGNIIAEKVILATNAYTSHLMPQLADLIVPCRGQMSALVPLPSVAGENRLRTSFGFESDLGDYLIQRPNERGGHLMFGGGRHTALVYTTDDTEVDDTTARYLRSKLIENLGLPEGEDGEEGECAFCHTLKLRCVRSSALKPCNNCTRLGQLCTNSLASSSPPHENRKEFRATHEWTGIMGFSRDEHPWVGPVPDKPNLYISAGYTGHGMVNTWLCGKAVALMVSKELDAGVSSSQMEAVSTGEYPYDLDTKFQRAGSMFDAVKEVGLPQSYLVTKARMLRAMDLDDVEVGDWREVERSRRSRLKGDRPPSGYA